MLGINPQLSFLIPVKKGNKTIRREHSLLKGLVLIRGRKWSRASQWT